MLELTLTLFFLPIYLFAALLTKEMLEESHKKNCEEAKKNCEEAEGDVEVDLETTQLKYTLLQINRVIFPPGGNDGAVDAASQEEQEDVTLDDVLLWVGMNLIESCVTKKVFSKEVKNRAGFWEWVTVSDVAYVLMILDLHYEVQKQAWVSEHKKEDPTASAVLNTAMRARYAEYEQQLKEIIQQKGGVAWKLQFNDRFRDAQEIVNKRRRKGTPSGASKGTGEANKETPEECLLRDLMNRFCPEGAVEV